MPRLRALLAFCLAASVFPTQAVAQVRVVVEGMVPSVPNTVLPSYSQPLGSISVLPSISVPSLSLSPTLSAPSIIPSAVAVKPLALKAVVAVNPAAAKAVSPSIVVTAAKPSVPAEQISVQAAALFDGASRLSAPSTPDPVDGKATESGVTQAEEVLDRRDRLPRRFTSRLARWTGVAALYSVWRDGVLVQRYAAKLSDRSSPPSRRATSARILASLGRVEAVPTLALAQDGDPSPRVRRIARAAMLAILRESQPKLIRTLRISPFASSRQAAAATLSWLSRYVESPDVVEALANAAALDRVEDVRLAAISALSVARGPRALAALEWMNSTETRPHMRSALALFSIWMSRRPPNSRKSYGYLKVESLVGLLGAAMIGFMGWEMATDAWARAFGGAGEAATWSVALFALSSLAANAFSALLLWRHHGDSLSVKGAFLHALTDAIGSFGVILSVAAALLFGWTWAEPVVVAMIVLMIAKTAWELGKPALNVLIDAVPEGIVLDKVEADLLTVPGAAGVDDLHVWALNSKTTALTATIFIKPGADHDQALATAKALMREKHGIKHVAIQIERIRDAR